MDFSCASLLRGARIQDVLLAISPSRPKRFSRNRADVERDGKHFSNYISEKRGCGRAACQERVHGGSHHTQEGTPALYSVPSLIARAFESIFYGDCADR
jgi:hypothetical protein